MKNNVEKAGNKIVKEGKEVLVKIWDKIMFGTLKSFVESVPRRLQMVIDGKRERINF